MSDFVTAKQFSDFIVEFRTFAHKVDSNFHEIRKEMAEGATRFALIEREVRDQNERSDEHSGKIVALEKKENVRAIEEDFDARSAQPKQHGVVATALITAGITIATTASCAIGYWLLSTYFQSQAPQSSTSTSKPPVGNP